MMRYIKNFTETGIDDVGEVGIKNALLGELYNHMPHHGGMPGGFAVTMEGYTYFMAVNGSQAGLDKILEALDTREFSNLEDIGIRARKLVMGAKFPKELESAITRAYASFDMRDQAVAVRCSSVGNDYYDGNPIYETHLNIKGSFALIYAIKCCFASVYSDRAIKYRGSSNIPHNTASVSIGVQQMVRSDLGCSGMAYFETITESPTIKISGVWGLGMDMPGNFTPDEYTVLVAEKAVSKKLGNKSGMLVYNEPAAGINTTNLKITPPELRDIFILSDNEAVELARLVVSAQKHFNIPMIFKWAKDGLDNNLHIIGVTPAEAKFAYFQQ